MTRRLEGEAGAFGSGKAPSARTPRIQAVPRNGRAIVTVMHVATNRWLWLFAVAVLMVALGAWAHNGAPTAVSPEAATRLRWGYDPALPTGLTDAVIPAMDLPSDYRIEQVLTGLQLPTHMDVLPDGRLLIAEQGGDVRIVEDGSLMPAPFASIDVYFPQLDEFVELGLTGLMVDAEFQDYPFVYVYYAADDPRRTAIARIRVEDGRAAGTEEIFAWESTPVCCHIGGGMHFLADGTFLVGMGDHELLLQAQNPLSPPGSILRFNRDGTFPDDNPFISWVFAYGLRNPYDVAVDPATGRVFAGENGFFGQDAIIEVERGANYGWPGTALNKPEEEPHEPLIFYHDSVGIGGLEFYGSDVLGALQGQLLYCRFNEGTVNAIQFAQDGSVQGETVVAAPCHTDVVTGPEGFVYFLDYAEGALHRIAR